MAVPAADVIASAYKLKGAPYRMWGLGMSIPTYLDDNRGDPPPASHLLSTGVDCADLICFALGDNGIALHAGTESFGDYLLDAADFDPLAPGEPGAVALRPYSGPDLADQGHIALYVGEHRLIQAIASPGVTDAFTDQDDYSWGGDTEFTIYGYLPGVTYGAGPPDVDRAKAPAFVSVNAQGLLVAEGPDWARGWWDRDWVWGGQNWRGD